MALAAYNTLVKVSGTAVATTGEAMTVTTGTTFQINTASKQVWDPSVTPVFYDGGVAILAAGITSVDYLRGKVTLAAPPGGAVTCDVTYFPLYTIAEGREFDADFKTDILDTTILHASDTHKKKAAGLFDASGSLRHLDALATDMDTGGNTMSWNTIMTAATAKVLELYPGQTSSIRMWVTFHDVKLSGQTDGLVEGACEWQLEAREGDYGATTWSIA